MRRASCWLGCNCRCELTIWRRGERLAGQALDPTEYMFYNLNMHSKYSAGIQDTPQQSFIEAARRAQIVAATIETLAEVGFAKASLAQIAKRAQIAPSLIPYHFSDKDTLVAHTLEAIADGWDSYIHSEVAAGASPTEQLSIYVVASITFLATRPAHWAALVEIVFNARTPDGVLLYRTEAEEPALTLLKSVLTQGQASGEFRQFDVHSMGIAIRGAITEFFGVMHHPETSLERYAAELVDLFTRATVA